MSEAARILVVEDDESMLRFLTDELREAGFRVLGCSSAGAALEQVRTQAVEAVVTDLVMPGMKGDELLRELRVAVPGVPVVIMTAFGSIESAVEAMREGAYHYLTKPFRIEQLVGTLESALADGRLRRQLHELAEGESERSGIVAQSPPMRRVLDLIARAAVADTPVLILGESGTGKELLARALHAAGPRHARAFLAVNCAAIPETLLEAELFGHERGAFTGAQTTRRGRFEQADGGTLFLDEIGDMPFDLQTRLLRVLSDGQFYRVGGHQPLKANVRVIAATHQNLEERVRQGGFREDLYHRLNVIRLRLPPLRERREDIPMLTRHFLQQSARQLGVEPKRISDAALAWLGQFAFPGNVRQLENMCHWLTVMAPAQVIEPKDLPPEVGVSHAVTAAPMTAENHDLAVSPSAQQTLTALAVPHELPEAPAAPQSSWEQGLEAEASTLLATDRTDVWDTLTARFESRLIHAALAATRGRRIDALSPPPHPVGPQVLRRASSPDRPVRSARLFRYSSRSISPRA